MAKKAAKTAWQRKQDQLAKDKAQDQDLYGVFEKGTDQRIYLGEGVPRAEAERLAHGLVHSAEVRLVRNVDGVAKIDF